MVRGNSALGGKGLSVGVGGIAGGVLVNKGVMAVRFLGGCRAFLELAHLKFKNLSCWNRIWR